MFLEGPPRIGKSTLIRNNLLPYATAVAGMTVQRLYEDGRICGYRACLVKGELPVLEAEYTDNIPGVFLYRCKYHPEILDQMICNALYLCEKSSCRLILFDEIGGLELSSPIFNKTLRELLCLGKPCLGVVKSRDNLINTLQKLNLSDAILNENKLLHRHIESDGEVIFVDEDNLKNADLRLKIFLNGVL